MTGTCALAAYEESLIIRRHLCKGDPTNASRQLNVAENLEKIGDLKLVAGDIDGAFIAYREMLSIDRRLVAIDGSNSEWQRNLLLSLERFGDVTLTVGDTVAAVAAYEQTISLHRRLAASGKTDTQWQKEVSASFEKISRLKRWAISKGCSPTTVNWPRPTRGMPNNEGLPPRSQQASWRLRRRALPYPDNWRSPIQAIRIINSTYQRNSKALPI